MSKMFTKFKRPNVELESSGDVPKKRELSGEVCVKCPSCKKTLFSSEVEGNFGCCYRCGYHFKISARKRIKMICDEGSFCEMFADLRSRNILDFPDYNEKLAAAEKQSGENEGVLTGVCTIGGVKSAVFVMDAAFMMGSMGSVLGEKVTLIFEYATLNCLPVVGVTVSGGARMQEGIISLMQMAKTAAAVKRHSNAGGLYVCVLTNPTTGGVTASFASLGDYTFAEPDALIGFAGPRVIEQTIKQRLPEGFQSAEFLMEKGFVDMIVPREKQREVLEAFLKIHSSEVAL